MGSTHEAVKRMWCSVLGAPRHQRPFLEPCVMRCRFLRETEVADLTQRAQATQRNATQRTTRVRCEAGVNPESERLVHRVSVTCLLPASLAPINPRPQVPNSFASDFPHKRLAKELLC